ncbi:MAG TPA: DUF2029 domain-containing protein [Candidatus Stackebrandtia excrementipullorum]|nr:DUF2029 domain-containing protein [Candidatus Stackebrandtia excrementipullorum]
MTAIEPQENTGTSFRPGVVEPSAVDPVVRSASQAVGGPLGRHAIRPPRRRFWTPLRVVLLSAIVMAGLSWLQKYPCADGGWENFQQYTQYCYSDIRALWGAERLDQGAVPYLDHPVEYPVLTGYFMGVFGLLSHALLGAAGGTLYFHLSAIVLLVMGVAAVAGLMKLRPSRPWDAMMLAAAPTVLFTAMVNWDWLPVMLTVFFLLMFARGRPVWAGVLWGLAVAAKFYPLLIAGPLLLLAWRYRRFRAALIAVSVAAVTWLVVNLPPMIWATDGWLRFFELNSERVIDWGTSWYVLRHFTEPGEPLNEMLNDVPLVNWFYLVAFVVACAAIAWLTLMSPTPPRLAQVAFLVVAAFLLTGKVWSQQYVMWLIPLAILARPQWRVFLVWQAGELFYFFGFYSQLLTVSSSDENPAPAWGLVIPEWVFIVAALARLVTLTILVVAVVRDVRNPSRDVVRATYGTDPDAGPLLPSTGPPTVRAL